MIKNIAGTLIALVVVYFISSSIYGNKSDRSIKSQRSDSVAAIVHIKNSNQAEKSKKVTVKSKPIGQEIEVLNELLQTMGFGSKGSVSRPPFNLNELETLADADIEEAIKRINDMAQDPEKNLMSLVAFNDRCSGLLTLGNRLDGVLSNHSLEKSLWDSGYCSRIGSEADPFYDIVRLARQGNQLAQLLLDGELYAAVERGMVNPKLYPREYNDLRYELVGYLKSLSAQGVSLASLKLSREYLNDGLFFSADRVLSYFYLSLYEQQHKNSGDYPWNHCFSSNDSCKSPAELYQTLTKDEKNRADQLLERIDR